MARWHSCNVLMPGSQLRQLWQFGTSGDKFNLQRQESRMPNEPLPEKLVAKSWQSIFQPRLNIAWLSAEKVFLRVVQLPKADAAETQSMVELQLEKISPLPTAQIVWSFEVFPYIAQGGIADTLNPHAIGELQTVVVIMVARHHVEEYLGQLEGQGYLADRLELPLLDELHAIQPQSVRHSTERPKPEVAGEGVPVEQLKSWFSEHSPGASAAVAGHGVGNGAWIFPGVGGHDGTCMVAWRYSGVLQNLSIIHLPSGEARAAGLQEQLAQTIWAGEVEGWMTEPPRIHLMADDATAAGWLPLFDLTQQVEVVPPLAPLELAQLTARRVTANGSLTNLLPPEYATRYKQQFVDRLWMRGLFAIILLYVFGVVIYFGFVQFSSYRLGSLQADSGQMGIEYTNTIRIREQLRVLQDTIEMQYAALDSYKALADTLPPELTLSGMNFERGRKLTIVGTVGGDDRSKVNDFWEALGKLEVRGQPLFSRVNAPDLRQQGGPQLWNWSMSADLKRTEAGE